jgi:DNA-3-methyladenine glycosylase
VNLSDPVDAARDLLGCILVHGPCSARIVETEAYRSVGDPASHAFRGQTPRNRVMFGPVGVAYVYFSYGNHWMLNVVAHPPGEAGAVLIRAAEPLTGIDLMQARRKLTDPRQLLNGPGKLCQAMAIGKEHYGMDLFSGGDVRIEPGPPPSSILEGPRVGIAIGKGHETPWRFIDADRLAWASRPRPS